MLARTSRIATSRLTQFSSQFSRKANTMATLHTKQKLNTGAEIRTSRPDPTFQDPPLTITTAAVGFGTWQDAGAQEAAVTEALKAGTLPSQSN